MKKDVEKVEPIEKPFFKVLSWSISPAQVFVIGKKGTELLVIDQQNNKEIGSGTITPYGVIIGLEYFTKFAKVVIK